MTTDIAMDVPATAQPETRSWTRRLPMIIGIILVIALAGWGVRRWLYSRTHVSSDNAQVDGHITSIAPRIAGFIDRVAVEENLRRERISTARCRPTRGSASRGKTE